MTDYRTHSGRTLRDAQGFTLLEIMTVVAILGILATFAFPSTKRMLDRQEAKASATQVAGLLSDARARALSEGTPHLVYFNPPAASADGGCAAMAVEVRDADHSYSITPGDDTREFKLSDKACQTVKPYGETTDPSAAIAAAPLPAEDRAVRAPDAAAVGIVPAVANTVASTVANAVSAVAAAVPVGNSGSGSSSPGNSGKGTSTAPGEIATAERTGTVAETVVNGATFPVDPNDGRAVIAFSERGVAVDPAHPTAWGSGAGGVYLTDGETGVYAAVVSPLGDVQLRVFDAGTSTWH